MVRMESGHKMDSRTEASGVLGLVQSFVNTVDLEDGPEEFSHPTALVGWLAARGLMEPGLPADARIARLVASVCGECNAGWMSGLEVSFRAAVFAKSRPEHLAEPTRRTLSRWFAKTATLVAHAAGQELVPVDHWPALTNAMPDGIRVGLARLRRPRQPLDIRLEYAGADDPAARLISVCVQVDDLVAIVTRRPSVTPATTLWPMRSHLLRWTTLPVVNRSSDLTGG